VLWTGPGRCPWFHLTSTTLLVAPELDEHRRLYRHGRNLVLLSGVVMSLGAPLIRLLENADAWQFLAYRSAAVVVCICLLLGWRYRRSVMMAFRLGGGQAVLGGVLLACAFISIVFSFLSTTIANALFLLSTAPLLTATLGWAVLGERPSRLTWVAVGIAICGAAVMVGEGMAAGDVFGDLMALAAAMAFAAYSVVIRAGRRTDMLPALFYAGAFSGMVAMAGATLIGTGLAVSGWDAAVSVTYGTVGISGGLVLYTLGSRYVPAAELNVLSLSEVVLGPLWVWLAFTEEPSSLTLVGGGIILVAVMLQAAGSWTSQTPEPGQTDS
jgi:drug/metabolite transporter, DME family